MNYLKVYCSLIRKAQKRTPPDGYTEKHHIFPKSIFGNNNVVVILTAREHYIAHALLEKIYIKRYGEKDLNSIKMTHAFFLMNSKTNGNDYFNSYLYESLRVRRAKIVSETMREYYRNNISPSLGRKMSEEHKKKIIKANIGRIPSDETRKKISEAKKGKTFLSNETKEKIKKARAKQIFTKESAIKRSETLKKMELIWMFDPNTRKNYRVNKNKIDEKLLEGLVVGFCPNITDETRKKLVAAANKRWSNQSNK